MMSFLTWVQKEDFLNKSFWKKALKKKSIEIFVEQKSYSENFLRLKRILSKTFVRWALSFKEMQMAPFEQS